jgi:hypothetical protein
MMKKRLLVLLTGLGLYSATTAQTAKVQVIHNCADAAASQVDVYVNGALTLDDFAFRTSTPFLDLPAGVNINVGIAPGNSASVNDTITSFNYNLMDGSNYVLVASGIVSPSGYNPAPAFNLEVFALGRLTATNPANTDVLIMHGATDAPTVDVKVPLGATLVNDLSYPSFSANYLELPTANYNVQVRNAAGTDVVAEYQAPLAALNLQGQALVVVASGFLNPANNSNGPAFGLWAAPAAGGPLVQLPSAPVSSTRLQVIHNCADAAAATVDVWLNNTLLIDNFQFRKASAFIDAPAGVAFDVTIQPANSTDTTNGLARFTYTLAATTKYVIVANGTVSATGYNPAQPFNLDVFAAGQEASGNPANTNILVYHGATDAPTVDIVAGAATLVDNISYAQFSTAYLQLPTADYVISVTDATGATTVASYGAPLATLNLQGASAVALASGFLNPANNSNGPNFGIWVALPSGGDLVPLPLVNPPSNQTARVQIIHNCADKAARKVDVYLNDSLLLDDFTFRTCTPFIDAPAVDTIVVKISPSNSTGPSNPLATFSYNLTANETYVIVANGTVSSSGYTPSQPFNLDVYAGAQEASGNPANTNVLVYHGVTDAPQVNIEAGGNNLVDSLAYAQFSDDYLELPTSNYTIAVKTTAGDTVAVYGVPLSTLNLQGASLVTLASGYLNRSANRNGSIFGLWVALPSGGNLIPLPRIVNDSARIQVIHNSADVAAKFVDVWLNDNKILNNFEFRTATPFISLPAGVDFDITIMDSLSTDTVAEKARFFYKLGEQKYILIAEGNISTTGYDPIVPFDIAVYDQAKEESGDPAKTSVLVYHGSTDAPVVDVVAAGSTLVDNLQFSQFSNGYLELNTANYTLNIKEGFGATILASYTAPLATLGLQGDALVALASGFLNPGSNSNGQSFGIWVSLPTGGALIPLPDVTGLNANSNNNIVVFPNPAHDKINFTISSLSEQTVLNIYSTTGQLVLSRNIPAGFEGNYMIDTESISSGLYNIELTNNSSRYIGKVSIIK